MNAYTTHTPTDSLLVLIRDRLITISDYLMECQTALYELGKEFARRWKYATSSLRDAQLLITETHQFLIQKIKAA